MSVIPEQKRSLSGYTKSTQQRMMNITNPLQNSLNKSLISNNKAKITATPDVNSKFISKNKINDSSKKTQIQTIKPKSPQIFKKITNLKPVNNNVIV